jgi:hypothetical protein
MGRVLSSGVAASSNRAYVEGYFTPEMMRSLNFHPPDPNEFTHERRREIANEKVKLLIRTTRGTVDSASFVFAHSILDDAATESCRIIAFANPMAWEDQFASKRHTLEEFRTRTFDEMYLNHLNSFLDNLDRNKSLAERIQLIHAKCPPSGRLEVLNEPFEYDPEQVARIDAMRRDIIHRLRITIPMETVEQDIAYAERTSIYLLRLVVDKYRLKLDLNDFFEHQKAQGAPSKR